MLAIQLMPSWLAGIMIAAAMAAMMSTADSQLLVASSSFVQDFYHKAFGRRPKPKTLVVLSRVVTLVVGLVGLAVALRQDPENPVGVVFWLVLYAWGGLASSFGPLLVLSLYWKRVTRAGAIAGMIAGSATVVIWKNVSVLSDFLYELVPGFVVSLLVIILVSLLTRPPEET
jgi:sodium/proline symporter